MLRVNSRMGPSVRYWEMHTARCQHSAAIVTEELKPATPWLLRERLADLAPLFTAPLVFVHPDTSSRLSEPQSIKTQRKCEEKKRKEKKKLNVRTPSRFSRCIKHGPLRRTQSHLRVNPMHSRGLVRFLFLSFPLFFNSFTANCTSRVYILTYEVPFRQA